MSQKLQQEKPAHWPTLNTVIMVEETIKNSENSVLSVAELKRKLPRQVNHNTLILILEYLEKSGKIAVGLKGITWVYTDSRLLRNLIKKGTEI